MKVLCSGCNKKASDTLYACKPCKYILHISCSKIPKFINHPAHPVRTLSLLPVPAYPSGRFYCNTCRQPGDGFSYHCQVCKIDIHTFCAVMPFSNNHERPSQTLMINQETVQRTPFPQNQAMGNQYRHQFGPPYRPPNMINPNQISPNVMSGLGTGLFATMGQSFVCGAGQSLGQEMVHGIMGGGHGGHGGDCGGRWNGGSLNFCDCGGSWNGGTLNFGYCGGNWNGGTLDFGDFGANDFGVGY